MSSWPKPLAASAMPAGRTACIGVRATDHIVSASPDPQTTQRCGVSAGVFI
jgi:hypothetical protein